MDRGDPGSTKCSEALISLGTEAMALLEPFSSLWQLAFKEPLWLVLLWHSKSLSGWSFSVASLKGTPLAGVLLHCSAQSGTQRATLSRVFLYWSAAGAGVWGERGYSDGSTPCMWLSSIALPP